MIALFLIVGSAKANTPLFQFRQANQPLNCVAGSEIFAVAPSLGID
jgi:hypothetical protein